MDIGFSNKSYLGLVDPALADVPNEWRYWDSKFDKWIDMNDDKVWRYGEPDGMPPEGITVLTSDGTNYHPLYYIMSGEYRWINIVNDDEAPLPFTPTKWRFTSI